MTKTHVQAFKCLASSDKSLHQSVSGLGLGMTSSSVDLNLASLRRMQELEGFRLIASCSMVRKGRNKLPLEDFIGLGTREGEARISKPREKPGKKPSAFVLKDDLVEASGKHTNHMN